jgi:DeoR family transcriptional regulator of aga operon/DeoR family fructose operon transcriptional repressor
MIPDLFLEERRQEILRRIQQRGRASVSELSQEFGVSEVTVRGDLQALAELNLIVRTHGGAVPVTPGPVVPSLALRRRQQVAEKERIGAAGAALIANGDAVFLDSSSTTLAIAQRLKHLRDVTLITNSLAIAEEALDMPGVTAVMPGGTLRRETASLVGVGGVEILRQYNIRLGFFGAHGITLEEGLTDVSAAEAETKRPLVGMCRRVIAVLDASKWGRVGVASFAGLQDVQTVITDRQAPEDLVGQVRAAGIEVLVA